MGDEQVEKLMDEERARIKDLTAQGLPRDYTPCPPYRRQGPRMRVITYTPEPIVLDQTASSATNSTDRLMEELRGNYTHPTPIPPDDTPSIEDVPTAGDPATRSTTLTYPSYGEYPDPDQPDDTKASKSHHAHVHYTDTSQVFTDYGTWTCHRCAYSDNLHPWHWCQQCKGARTLASNPTLGTGRKWGATWPTVYNREAARLLRLTKDARHRA